MTQRPDPDTPAPPAKPKRVRLTPDVRRQQILDAALVEFGALGFTAASISKIAARAGTSKANLYVHFANKDEIFESLLKMLLVPTNSIWTPMEPGQDMHALIDSYVDAQFNGLSPQSLAVIRLLIAESHRIPALANRWYEQTIVPAKVEQQQRIDDYVAAGRLRQTPLSDYFGFVMAPVLYAAVMQMAFGGEIAETESHKAKETLRKLLHQMLPPAGEAAASQLRP